MAKERASGMMSVPIQEPQTEPMSAFGGSQEFEHLRNSDTVFNPDFVKPYFDQQQQAQNNKVPLWNITPCLSSGSKPSGAPMEHQAQQSGQHSRGQGASEEQYHHMVAEQMKGMYSGASGSSDGYQRGPDGSHYPRPHDRPAEPASQIVRARFGMEFEFAPAPAPSAPQSSQPRNPLMANMYSFGTSQSGQWKATPPMESATGSQQQQQHWQGPPPYWPNQRSPDAARNASGSSGPAWSTGPQAPPWNIGPNGVPLGTMHPAPPNDFTPHAPQNQHGGPASSTLNGDMPRSLLEYGLNTFMNMNGSVRLPNVGPQVSQSADGNNGGSYPDFNGLDDGLGGDNYGSGNGGDYHSNGDVNGNGDASGSGGTGGDGNDGDGSGGAGDAPRKKKLALACHFCRRRKLKCDGIKPTCENCSRRGEVCTYDDNVRRRGPGKRTKERSLIKDASGLLQEEFDPHSIDGMNGALTDGGTPGDGVTDYDPAAFQHADGTFDTSAFQHDHTPIDPSLLDPGDDYPTDDATAAAVAAAVAEHAERNANARAINELQMHLQAYPELAAGVDLGTDEGDGSDEPLTLAELGENMAAATAVVTATASGLAAPKRDRDDDGVLTFDLTDGGVTKRIKLEGDPGDA